MAYIHPSAQIGQNVTIDPFATIHAHVTIDDGSYIGSNVVVYGKTSIGKNCKIFPGAVIGADPQDLKYRGEQTEVFIGDNVQIRECCTINKGTKAYGKTVVESNTLLMAYVHVAHDCHVKNDCIIANAVNIAGHVTIGAHVVSAACLLFNNLYPSATMRISQVEAWFVKMCRLM